MMNKANHAQAKRLCLKPLKIKEAMSDSPVRKTAEQEQKTEQPKAEEAQKAAVAPETPKAAEKGSPSENGS